MYFINFKYINAFVSQIMIYYSDKFPEDYGVILPDVNLMIKTPRLWSSPAVDLCYLLIM